MRTIFMKALLLCGIAFMALTSNAQNAVFLKQGNITYEKKVNILAVMKASLNGKDNNIWMQKAVEAYENSGRSPSVTSTFNLAFNGNKSLYTPLDEEPPQYSMAFAENAASNNIVYTNLDSMQSISEKSIFDQNFTVKDSIRQIKWKITDETRTIAGFQCRRANALVMDSIYVVAFYTNDIVPSEGPESFSGLPGMILGLALPHKHVTWFATKVSVSPAVDASAIVPATPRRKSTTLSRAQLYEQLNKRLKEWGDNGQKIMENSLL